MNFSFQLLLIYIKFNHFLQIFYSRLFFLSYQLKIERIPIRIYHILLPLHFLLNKIKKQFNHIDVVLIPKPFILYYYLMRQGVLDMRIQSQCHLYLNILIHNIFISNFEKDKQVVIY